jgi:hypothetical protein
MGSQQVLSNTEATNLHDKIKLHPFFSHFLTNKAQFAFIARPVNLEMANFLLFFILSVSLVGLSRSFINSYLQSNATYRFPNNTAPDAYDIYLSFDNFDQDQRFFEGEVRIKIKVLEDTNNITLHEKVDELNVELTDENNVKIDVETEVDSDLDFMVIFVDGGLVKDSYVNLKIGYRGELRNDGFGVYTRSYQDENSVTRFGMNFLIF